MLKTERPPTTKPDDLPGRLRARRKSLGLTMQAVADASGLSVGFISQIERGIATPSLTSLVSVASALDLAVEHLLGTQPVHGSVARAEGRSRFTVGNGRDVFEPLSSGVDGMKLNSVLVRYAPNSAVRPPTAHDGEEFFYVLEGEIHLDLDGETRVLRAGDAAHYASSIPHAVRNPGAGAATVLWVGTKNLFRSDGMKRGCASGDRDGEAAGSPTRQEASR